MNEPDVSLEEKDPNDAAIAWTDVLKQRVAEVESGAVELVPGERLSAQCREILAAARRDPS